jgi:MFS transporter, DHA3 family, multidrug efflux protein
MFYYSSKGTMRNFYHLLGNTVLTSVTNMTVWFAIIFYAYLQTHAVFATSLLRYLVW